MTPPGAGEPAQPAAPSCAHRCRARAPTCLARGICARPRSLRQRPTSAVLIAGKVPDAASADCWPCAAHVMCAARFLGAESPYRLKCDWMLDSLNSLSANRRSGDRSPSTDCLVTDACKRRCSKELCCSLRHEGPILRDARCCATKSQTHRPHHPAERNGRTPAPVAFVDSAALQPVPPALRTPAPRTTVDVHPHHVALREATTQWP